MEVRGSNGAFYKVTGYRTGPVLGLPPSLVSRVAGGPLGRGGSGGLWDVRERRSRGLEPASAFRLPPEAPAPGGTRGLPRAVERPSLSAKRECEDRGSDRPWGRCRGKWRQRLSPAFPNNPLPVGSGPDTRGAVREPGALQPGRRQPCWTNGRYEAWAAVTRLGRPLGGLGSAFGPQSRLWRAPRFWARGVQGVVRSGRQLGITMATALEWPLCEFPRRVLDLKVSERP